MSESDVQKAIIDFLRIKGHYCQRINSGTVIYFNNGKKNYIKLADAGTPDILSCINGRMVGVEVKKDDKEAERWFKRIEKFKKTSFIPPSYQREITQHKQHEKIRKAGGIVIVTGSMEDFIKDYNSICDQQK